MTAEDKSKRVDKPATVIDRRYKPSSVFKLHLQMGDLVAQ
jgi:hypothetical protein